MITIVGSLNMDLVFQTDRIPRPGETVLGRGFKQIPGGKGANQAAAAARLGGQVTMIGCVGADPMGTALRDSLARDGVNVENIFVLDTIPTGVAAIMVDENGNNSITVAPGANYMLTTDDINHMAHVISDSDLLLTQLETRPDTVLASLAIAKKAGKITILNPAPATQLDDVIFKLADILTPNETELELLSGLPTRTLEEIGIAGRSLLQKGVKELVVTLGEKGCMHLTGDREDHYEAYRVKPVDTTAAGDSFNAALAVFLSKGKSMEEAIQFAMKVGAMTVTKEGAQTSLPLLSEVEQFDAWLLKQSRL